MKKIRVCINENGIIKLPGELVKQLQLGENSQIDLTYEPARLADKCFVVEESSDDALTRDEFYCIPMDYLERVGIENGNIQILLGEKEITLTTTMNVLNVIPTEFLGAMIDQKVNLTELADNVVERINNNVFETEEHF